MIRLGTASLLVLQLQACVSVCAVQARCPNPHSPGANSEADLPNITAAMIREDPRLTEKITIRLRSARVAEFLAEVSRQTGIEIHTRSRDDAGDTVMTFVCSATPADHMLNGLWSCLSHKGAWYAWERTGNVGHYGYRFVQTDGARRLRARLRDMAQQRFERDMAALLAVTDGTEEQKRRALSQITDDPDNFARDLGLTSDRAWTDLRSLNEALTPQQRQQLIHGQSTSAPLISLSPASRKFYEGIYQSNLAQQAQAGAPGPALSEPKVIRFNAVTYYSLPSIAIDVPNCTTFMPVIGGVHAYRAWKAELERIWHLDGDSVTDAAVVNRIEEEPASLKPDPPDSASPVLPGQRETGKYDPESGARVDEAGNLARHWEQVAVGAHVPLICRLVEDVDVYDYFPDVPNPVGLTLEAFIAKLWNRQHLVKWHDSVMLVTNTRWPNDDPPISGALLARLRADAKPGCIMPMQDLLDAADALTDRQLKRIASEFPVMREVGLKRDLFLFLKRRPDLMRLGDPGKVIPLDRALKDAIKSTFSPKTLAVMEKAPPSGLSVTFIESNDSGNAYRQINLLFKGNDGRVIGLMAFRELPIPLKKRVESNR